MKRYEQMTKEEIIDSLTLKTILCSECSVGKRCGSIKEENPGSSCSKIRNIWINEEIETIPRAWTFSTLEEAHKAWKKECKQHFCTECKYRSEEYNGANCVARWLYEEVENEQIPGTDQIDKR